MALVKTPQALQTMQFLGTPSGRNAMLGDWSKYDAAPATKLAKLHHAVADAVKRVSALEWDKTRSEPQKHSAARKIGEAVVAEISRTRAELKAWAESETAAAMVEIDSVLTGDIGTAAQVLRSEIRQFVRASLTGDKAADFTVELRGLVERDLRFASALLEAPAALSGLSGDRLKTLRLDAAVAHAPKAAARVKAAQEVAGLDAKLANVALEVPRSFYSPGIEQGMASRVLEPSELPLTSGND